MPYLPKSTKLKQNCQWISFLMDSLWFLLIKNSGTAHSWFLLTLTTGSVFSFTHYRFFISPQHFPLYRQTEAICTGVDAPPPEEKRSRNREKWEVVSKEMSNKLLSLIRPRLVLSGHTHHGCYMVHKDGTPEMTIPSFSWRNRNNPSFVLVSGSNDSYWWSCKLCKSCGA